MTTTLDIAALIAAVAMPAVVLLALLWFREPLSIALRELPKRLESVSVGGVTVRLREAKEGSLVGPGGRVDLRKAGAPQDVNDSTLRNFYEQVRDPAPIDYAVVDLKSGRSWLASRLYILSIILRRMRGLGAVVFVATAGTTRRRFTGVCPSEAIRWRLASRWPRFESALAAAELQVWGHPYGVPPSTPINVPPVAGAADQAKQIRPLDEVVKIVNDDGRIENAYATAAPDLLREFLAAIQRPAAAVPEADWEELPETSPPRWEFGEWLDAELVEELLDGVLEQHALLLSDMQTWNDETRAKAILEHRGDWIAVCRHDYVFDHLIDRALSLESAVAGMAAR